MTVATTPRPSWQGVGGRVVEDRTFYLMEAIDDAIRAYVPYRHLPHVRFILEELFAIRRVGYPREWRP